MKSEELLRQIRNEDLAGTQMKDRHRVAFLAMRDAISIALDGGATAKRIWKTLQHDGKIDCSYQTFSRYVSCLIVKTDSTQKPPAVTTKQSNSAQKPPETPKPQPVNTSSDLRGFHHDPTAFTKEDILG